MRFIFSLRYILLSFLFIAFTFFCNADALDDQVKRYWLGLSSLQREEYQRLYMKAFLSKNETAAVEKKSFADRLRADSEILLDRMGLSTESSDRIKDSLTLLIQADLAMNDVLRSDLEMSRKDLNTKKAVKEEERLIFRLIEKVSSALTDHLNNNAVESVSALTNSLLNFKLELNAARLLNSPYPLDDRKIEALITGALGENANHLKAFIAVVDVDFPFFEADPHEKDYVIEYLRLMHQKSIGLFAFDFPVSEVKMLLINPDHAYNKEGLELFLPSAHSEFIHYDNHWFFNYFKNAQKLIKEKNDAETAILLSKAFLDERNDPDKSLKIREKAKYYLQIRKVLQDFIDKNPQDKSTHDQIMKNFNSPHLRGVYALSPPRGGYKRIIHDPVASFCRGNLSRIGLISGVGVTALAGAWILRLGLSAEQVESEFLKIKAQLNNPHSPIYIENNEFRQYFKSSFLHLDGSTRNFVIQTNYIDFWKIAAQKHNSPLLVASHSYSSGEKNSFLLKNSLIESSDDSKEIALVFNKDQFDFYTNPQGFKEYFKGTAKLSDYFSEVLVAFEYGVGFVYFIKKNGETLSAVVSPKLRLAIEKLLKEDGVSFRVMSQEELDKRDTRPDKVE